MDMDKEIIIRRFFLAIERLKEDDILRGLKTFTDKYDINRRNLIQCRNDPKGHGGIFQPEYIMYLARDYMVSPAYLLLGDGSFYRDGWDAEKVKKMQM